MNKLRDHLAFKYINWVFGALFNVHNSNLIYNHKVRGDKMGWKIIYASLDACVRSHARNENEFQTSKHVGSATNIEKLCFQILVNPKLCQKFMKHGMVSCEGTHMPWYKIPSWPCFVRSLLQTWGSHTTISYVQCSDREHIYMHATSTGEKWHPMPLLSLIFS